jgi:hypothetical protein
MIIQKFSGGTAHIHPLSSAHYVGLADIFACDKAPILLSGQVKFSLRCKG